MNTTRSQLIDANQLSALLQMLYSSVTSGNWQPFLQQVMELTKSNKAFVSLKNIKDDSPLFLNITFNFDYSTEAVIAYQQRPFDDPLFDVVRFLPEGDIIEPTKVLDFKSYCDTEFYRFILKPLRNHHALGLVVIRDGIYDSSFVVNRGEDDPPYSAHEYQLLELLKPHVQQAMRLFTLFRDIRQQNDMLKVVLDQSGKALLVIDADCTIKLLNQQAERLLAILPYWHNAAGRFYLKNNIEQRRLTQLIAQCLEQQLVSQERQYLQLTDTEPQICLSLAPLHWLKLDDNIENLCLLTIDYQQRISWGGVKEEYDLTPRELELAQALHNNKKLTELSTEMGISYHTLRRHLQAIFIKFRVNSQSELMLLLSRFRH